MLNSRIRGHAAACMLALSVWTAPALAQLEVNPEETTPLVDIGKQAVIMKDGQLRVQIDVSCGSRWEVMEATVHVMQNGQQSSNVAIPAVCGPADQPVRHDVLIPAIPGGFQAGTAEATASIVLRDTTTNQTTPLSDTATVVVRTLGTRQTPPRDN